MAPSSADGAVELLESFPECSDLTDGLCVEVPPSGKGMILFTSFHHCSESFINLPGINLLPTWLLAVIWGLFLIWTFFGVAVLSDAFVEGIEVITSKTKKVTRTDGQGRSVEVEEPVWNWAVANITLLAVGSSSPEILLAVVETLLTLGKAAGEIGPSCIIGSGSYNLFGIIAICTVSLPAGTFKRIQHIKVFIWTTGWSLWAHVWIYLVYKVVTPGSVEIWEAFLTLAYMPIFVFTTYLVDTRGWNWFGAHKNSIVSPENMDDDGVPLGLKNDSYFNPSGRGHQSMTDGHPVSGRPSILYYRNLAVQRMAGGGGASVRLRDDERKQAAAAANDTIVMEAVEGMGQMVPKVLFKTSELSVLESKGEVRVEVVRMHGDLQVTVIAHYRCQDDTAVSGLDYEAAEGTLVFGPGETVKEIVVKIVDDDMSEPDVQFSVVLTGAEVQGGGRCCWRGG